MSGRAFSLATPAGLPTPAGDAHVATIGPGRLVWTSGQVGLPPDGGDPPEAFADQARLVFENVGRALEAGGATWRDVVKLTVFLVDRADLPAFREVRDAFVDTIDPPTSSLVLVAGLVRPDLLVEVEAVAAIA